MSNPPPGSTLRACPVCQGTGDKYGHQCGTCGGLGTYPPTPELKAELDQRRLARKIAHSLVNDLCEKDLKFRNSTWEIGQRLFGLESCQIALEWTDKIIKILKSGEGDQRDRV